MKYIKQYDNYTSDVDIEAQFEKYIIIEFRVDKLFDDGGASGLIVIEFNSDTDDESTNVDNWLKYDSSDKIVFDNWYPAGINSKLKKYIEHGIKEEKIKRESEKYNL